MLNLETSLHLLQIQTFVIVGYITLFLYSLNSLDLTKLLSFLLSHELNAVNHVWHWMAYFVLMCR